MIRLNSKQLREVPAEEVEPHAQKLKRNPIYLILENIYDTYNIGGLFRLADALAVEKIYLCGEMEIPPHHKIAKASVGTYKIVPWEYKETAKEAIESLRVERSNLKGIATSPLAPRNDISNIQILAVEQSEKSIPYTQAEITFPVALVVGNETYGVLPETLDLVGDSNVGN
ncbi:MAG TPA: TrmH family RNA methyltransferase [Candidatus Woesebacteria bacterium]|nr:TrmH family RNA methyltransferase [Candidatus Woesebacteria bacterium]